jgi:hypothetical protein
VSSIRGRIKALVKQIGLGRLWDGETDRPGGLAGYRPFDGEIDRVAHPGAWRCQAMMGACCALAVVQIPSRAEQAATARELVGAGPDDPPERVAELLLEHCRLEYGFSPGEIAETRRLMRSYLEPSPNPWATSA